MEDLCAGLFEDSKILENDILFLDQEFTRDQIRRDIRESMPRRASLGQQLLSIFKTVPYAVADWNETTGKYEIYDWELFVRHITNYGYEVKNYMEASRNILRTFKRAGICLEVDVDPLHADSDLLIHKLHHPLLKQNDYEKAKHLGWCGPLARPTHCLRTLEREVAVDLFPQLRGFDLDELKPL